MALAAQILEAHPTGLNGLNRDALAKCVEECLSCTQVCTSCADACLSEPNIAEMTKCVRSALDCADICDTTGRVLSRQTAIDIKVVRSILGACAAACKACADECEHHASMHEHCRICAEACRRCEQACQDLLASLA